MFILNVSYDIFHFLKNENEHESSKLNDKISDFYDLTPPSEGWHHFIFQTKGKMMFCSPDWSHRCCRGAVACSGSHCWSSLRCTPVTQKHTSYCDEGEMKHLQFSQSDVSLWKSKCVPVLQPLKNCSQHVDFVCNWSIWRMKACFWSIHFIKERMINLIKNDTNMRHYCFFLH